MLKSEKKIPLQNIVISIVVIIITILGFIIYNAVGNNVEKMLHVNQEKNIDREINAIEKEIISYIDTMKIILNDNSKSPIVTQAVMQPEYGIANFKDFLDDLKILDNQFNVTAVDFRAKTIYSNNHIGYSDYSSEKWTKKIILEEIESYKGVSKINSNYYWTIAVPVKYNGSPEGILIAEVPIEDVYRSIGFSSSSEVQLEIIKDSELILTIGEVENGWERIKDLPELGIKLKFIVDSTDSINLLKQLRNNILLVIFSFIIITVLVLIFVSRRFIVRPLNRLKGIMDKFMEKGSIASDRSGVLVKEISQLQDHFIDMSLIIRKREDELKVSEKSLIGKNEKLESLINELESTQSMIIQQEKLASIGRLAAGVAHELNNPIGFVSGNFTALKDYVPMIVKYIEYLKSENKEDVKDIDLKDMEFILGDIPELIEESEEGLNRVTEIVKNLKEYSRIDRVKDDNYELNKGVTTTLMIAKNEYKYVATVNTNLGEVPDVKANGNEINEVILNIIVNAAQALGDYETDIQKTIDVKTYSDDNYVYCEISDNGPGIPPDIIDKIFDPFFTTKEPGKGTGLGLNIAYNIIKNKHDGELLVNSTEGKGTTFVIMLPIFGEE